MSSPETPLHPELVVTDPSVTEDVAPSHPTRRDFAKTLAVAAAVPLLGGVGACAPAAPAPAPSTVPGAPAVTPDSARAAARPVEPLAAALGEVIQLRFGTRLSAAEMDKVRRGIEGNLQAAKALREFPLPISTEPAAVFQAYRGGPP